MAFPSVPVMKSQLMRQLPSQIASALASAGFWRDAAPLSQQGREIQLFVQLFNVSEPRNRGPSE